MENLNWKRVKENLLDILFPRFCFGCGKEGIYICQSCSLFLTENNLICPICGKASYGGKTHNDCSTKYTPDGLVSIWDYEGMMRKAILSIKGNDNYHAAEKIMERAFLDVMMEDGRFTDFLEFFLMKNTKITFVATDKKEKEIRITSLQLEQKNHAEEIAKKLARIAPKKKEVISLLAKVKKTKKQSELSKKERLKNVKGAFEAKSEEIPEKLILVDDVFTTGATMRECANKLKRSGAKKVWGFTLARSI